MSFLLEKYLEYIRIEEKFDLVWPITNLLNTNKALSKSEYEDLVAKAILNTTNELVY